MIRFTHIPKTAGYSVYTEFHPPRFNFSKAEACAPYFYVDAPEVVNGAMFRRPIDHVFSQYKECRYDVWGKKVTAGTSFPRSSSIANDFETWLRHFQTPTRDHYRCYHPFNMQTRYMLCNESSGHNHYMESIDLSDAYAMIDRLQWVGVQHMFHESMCVLYWKHARWMPASCDCVKRQHPAHPHVTHNVPRLNGAHSERVLQMIRNLTRYDQYVFEYATRRALADIWSVQNLSKRVFLCGVPTARR